MFVYWFLHVPGLIATVWLTKTHVEPFVHISERSAAASFIKTDEWVAHPPWIQIRGQTAAKKQTTPPKKSSNEITVSRFSSFFFINQIPLLNICESMFFQQDSIVNLQLTSGSAQWESCLDSLDLLGKKIIRHENVDVAGRDMLSIRSLWCWHLNGPISLVALAGLSSKGGRSWGRRRH